MNPLKIFIAVIFALFVAILASLLFIAAMVGDWFTFIVGAVGASAMIGLGAEVLRS